MALGLPKREDRALRVLCVAAARKPASTRPFAAYLDPARWSATKSPPKDF
jgi:hypothetical protein